MTRAEYERMKQQRTTEYRDDLAALERVWKMAEKDISPSPNGDTATEQEQTEEDADKDAHEILFGRGDLLGDVRTAMEKWHTDFTIVQLHKYLEREQRPGQLFKRPSIASALRRLVKIGEIKIVEQGAGRKATIYRKVKG